MTAREANRTGQFALRGGERCLDFVNTVAWRRTDRPVDYLASVRDLMEWGRQTGVLAPVDLDRHGQPETKVASDEVLARARSLRETIHRVVMASVERSAPADDDLALLNRAVSEARAHQRLIHSRGTQYDWRWDGGTAVDRVLWCVAASAAELLTTSRIDRVRMCAGTGCGWLFVDASRNRSRRWCDTRDCGNRERVRRHLATKQANRSERPV